MKQLVSLLAALVVLGILAVFPQAREYIRFESDFKPAISEGIYSVVHVADGDTFTIDIDGEKERVRLIGVDTPEMVDPHSPVECFAQEATTKTKELVFGKSVRIELDPSQGERDTYGRLLAYAFLPDGTLLNKYLVAEGYGSEYTFNRAYIYQKEFKAAQAAAQHAKKGLWANNACGK
jgi:micrococcal nuclease